MSDDRAIELEIEVPGTPEEVWEAIATGPGITAWFVPTTVEGRAGGAITQDFGGPQMQVTGFVHAWEPPHRFAYGEGPEPTAGGMAFEFLVEAKDQSTCIVRLVNSGFGSGEDWDDQFDSTEKGWRIFLHILSLHLRLFAGQTAHRVQAMAMIPAPEGPDALWSVALDRFDLDVDSTLRADRAFAFTIDEPAPGTGFLAVEGSGETLAVSLWLSLYGPGAEKVAQEQEPRLQSWVDALGSNGGG